MNLHFSAAQPNFRILEYRLPHGPNYAFGGGGDGPDRSQGAWYVKDPYLPKDGYLELRPDRPGWGVEMDMEMLGGTTTSTGSARCRSGRTAQPPLHELRWPLLAQAADPKRSIATSFGRSARRSNPKGTGGAPALSAASPMAPKPRPHPPARRHYGATLMSPSQLDTCASVRLS